MSFARLLFIAITFVSIMPLPASAQSASGDAPVTHAELPALIKQAILNDPEMVMEAAQKLRDKQVAESEKQAGDALKKHKSDIYSDANTPVAGNTKNPDVTIVEFFDYHCGYCKHMLPSITQLIKDDKKVRVVFKEFPILSEDSVSASRAALAVYYIAPDKYFDYYTELMNSSGKFDEAALLASAKKIGVDPDKLKAEMGKPEISAQLDKNRSLGEDMGIHGTPAIIIGDHVVPGAMPYEELKKAVDEARNGKKSGSDATPKS